MTAPSSTGYDVQNSTLVNIVTLGNGPILGSPVMSFTNCVLANITNLSGNAHLSADGAYNGLYRCPVFGANRFTNTSSPF